ncbi:MAG: bile acid:sodium symporter [Lautropia sp.]
MIRTTLERHQVSIYFAAVLAGTAVALGMEDRTSVLEHVISPALALMLFVTFLQVPIVELKRAASNLRFLGVLLAVNFLILPLLVWALTALLPSDPLVRLGVLLVLLTPCIDYVVTFSHLGRADSRALLASTPVLLIVQILLLPIYLGLILGWEAAQPVRAGPFVEAFIWLIAAPLALAALMQLWAARRTTGMRIADALGTMPVPATALVLFVVAAAVVPRLGAAQGAALAAAPVYVLFAIAAPLLGWLVARQAGLDAASGRAIAFSAGTRNSLVVLPLALAVPGAVPVLPAVIVMQTLVELLSELAYVRLIRRLGASLLSPLDDDARPK